MFCPRFCQVYGIFGQSLEPLDTHEGMVRQ